ncbi:MAG: hypothetical protein ACXADA_22340 [Candidatus Hodarchaeales archaeon]|jgi:hypothetical protein
MFNNDPTLDQVELVGVICPVCSYISSAPKIARVSDTGINVGGALYRAQKALETKQYGRFRFIDRFGLGRYTQQQDGQGGGRRSMFLWVWILGLRTIILIAGLYYILGFEMKLGSRWIPLGAVLSSLVIIMFIIIALTTDILNPVTEFIRSLLRNF